MTFEYLNLKAPSKIYKINQKNTIKYWFWLILILAACILALPWTQNIRAKGKITTRMQEQRPQAIQSPIGGKIIKWWIKEGDYVKKGDTILQLSEIKNEYLDPKLIQRTREQLEAKKRSIALYQDKAQAAQMQKNAIDNSRSLKVKSLQNKLGQLQNKLKAEKAELKAVESEVNLSNDQLKRQEKMFTEGLVSQTELQRRMLTYQNAVAKQTVLENKIAQTLQEIINNEVEQNSAIQENYEKLQKTEGERISSLNEAAVSEGEVAKLENIVNNYVIRNNMYIMVAPQDGQIVQARKGGIGEIVKEGETITEVVPVQDNYAVEMFIRPVDFPLIKIGQKVRFTFDGFPAIVFSGWPQGSYGTFGGKVVAYENNVNDNGYFRVIVVHDEAQPRWPSQIKVGSGAQGILLLNDVPVIYELWRNINGFPPDFYKDAARNDHDYLDKAKK
jgi:multidrug resistance efflux pump